MATTENGQEKKSEGQSGGFHFEKEVTATTQTFIDHTTGDIIIYPPLTTTDLQKLDEVLKPVKEVVTEQTKDAPEQTKQQAEAKTEELKGELAKGKNANAERLNKILDALVDMVPGALSAAVSMFASPILGALVGPTTQIVLGYLQGKQKGG